MHYLIKFYLLVRTGEWGGLFTVFFVICVWMASVLFLAYLFRGITKKFSLKEVNLADKAVFSEGLEDNESIFNKNMDEIVYFFEETKLAEKGVVKKAFNAKKDFVDDKILALEKQIEPKQTLLDKVDRMCYEICRK